METTFLSKPAVTVRAAGYGKHPAWSDHIEGLGTATPLLSRFAGEAYLGAISGLITTGQWPSASSGKPFATVVRRFLWQVGTDFVFGWMWPSADQVGRDHYPMILCAQVTGRDLVTALPVMDPLFREAMADIRGLQTQEEIRARVRLLEDSLLRALTGIAAESEQIYLRKAAEWYRTAPLKPMEWQRLFYFLQAGYASASFAEGGSRLLASKKTGPTEYEAMRLQVERADGVGGMVSWTAFLRSQLRSNVPLLLVMQEDGEWCDVVLGTITAGGFGAVLGGLDQFYLVTSVPFDIKEDLLASMQRAVQSLDVPWGSAPRSTIFGEVPARFRPGLPAAAAASGGQPSPRPAEPESKPLPTAVVEPETRPVVGAAPWKKIIGISVGVAVVAGLAVAFAISRGSAGRTPRQEGGPATNASVTPVPAQVPRPTLPELEKDLTARWRRYWALHDQLTNAVRLGINAPDSLWASEMKAALGEVSPGAWDPWTVVFGGKEKVRGAEIATIATSRLEAQAANLQTGAAAAERLLQAVTTGYPARLQASLTSMEGGPAAGLVPGWKRALADGPAPGDAGARVANLLRVEAELQGVMELVKRWETAWGRTAPLEPWVVEAVRGTDLQTLRKAGTLDGLKPAVEASVLGLAASRDWATEAMTHADTNHLARVLKQAGNSFGWGTWSNAVAGSHRLVPTGAFEAMEEFVAGKGGAGLGSKLSLLGSLSPEEARSAAEKLVGLSNGVAALRAVPLVRANASEVNRFQALQVDALALSNVVFTSWSRVANPAALVSLYRQQHRFTGPIQGYWSNHIQLIETRVAGAAEADPPAAARRWKGTLDSIVGFYQELERDTRFRSQLQSPFGPQLTEAAWQGLVGAWLSVGTDRTTLQSKLAPAAVVESLERELNALRRVGSAAGLLEQAWAGGAWTNTVTARETLAQVQVASPLDEALKSFDVPRLRSIATEVWTRPLPATLGGGGRDVRLISALCERVGGETTGPVPEERWKLACELAGQLLSSSGWRNFDVQRQWFGRLWKGRLGEGLPLEGLRGLLAPVQAHAGLAAWLPPAAQVHQRWSEIEAALGAQQLVQARSLLGVLREDIRQGKLKDLPGNLAILDQLIAQRLPENRYDRVDWTRTSQGKPFRARRDGSQNQAVIEFSAGFSLTFLLPADGVNASILVAQEELSARDLAVLLTSNADLRKGWLEQRLPKEPGLSLVRPASDTTDPYQVWNNISSRDGRQFAAQSPRVPDTGILGKKAAVDLGDLGERLPANFLSAVVAEKIASTLGARLPTPVEWNQLSGMGGTASPRFGAWEKVADGLAQAYLKVAGNDGGTFSNTRSLASSGGRQGEAGGPFMVDVGRDPSSPALRHWRGNIAEYLRAPDGAKYFLAGGSFANPTVEPRELASGESTTPYIDAGLRLVVDRVDSDELGQARALISGIRLGVP